MVLTLVREGLVGVPVALKMVAVFAPVLSSLVTTKCCAELVAASAKTRMVSAVELLMRFFMDRLLEGNHSVGQHSTLETARREDAEIRIDKNFTFVEDDTDGRGERSATRLRPSSGWKTLARSSLPLVRP